MRLVHTLAALGLTACIAGAQDAGNLNLSRLPPGKVALIGTFRVFNHGHEQTGRTAIEVTGDSRGYQLPPSGDVVWVVDRPSPDAEVRLSGISTLDYFQNFAGGLVLSRAETAPCSYFGTVTIRINQRREDDLAQAVVGVSIPGGGATQAEDGEVGLRRIVRGHPTLAGATCDAVLSGSSVELH